jgi:hypothetical protein
MKIHVMQIPDDPAALVGWLGEQLVGPHLAELVAELHAVHGKAPAGPDLDRLLGANKQRVLQAGLDGLPQATLAHLLTHPDLLLELQELVLTEGGGFWADSAILGGGWEERVRSGRHRLDDFLMIAAPPTSLPGALRAADLPPSRAKNRWRPAAFLSMAAAAALLVVAYSFDRSRNLADIRVAELTNQISEQESKRNQAERNVADLTNQVAELKTDQAKDRGQIAELQARPAAAPGWGWNKPANGAPPSASAYLASLEQGAQDWFKKRPDDRIGLAQRLLEFRQGCDKLILVDHPALAEVDRRWLVRRCRNWAGQLDRHLANLEGGNDILQVRNEIDKTVREITESLKARADDLAS